MEKFILSTDSCCDELKSTLKRDKIEYIPMCYISNGEIYEDNFNSTEEYKYFYDEMKKGKIFSTTGLNPFQLKEYFLNIIAKTNMDIVHIALSSGLSGTCGLAVQVANEINETSAKKVYVVDSLSATQGQNAILCHATLLRNEGKSAEEAVEALNETIKNLDVSFFLGDLEALKRGGRISGAQAVVAKVMQLRPVLKFDSEGRLQVIEKAMGSKKAVMSLLNRLKNYNPNSPIPIFIAYAGDVENALVLRKLIETKYGITNIILGHVGPVICSHTGPALTGLIFVKK